jgi:hypothetical protein
MPSDGVDAWDCAGSMLEEILIQIEPEAFENFDFE